MYSDGLTRPCAFNDSKFLKSTIRSSSGYDCISHSRGHTFQSRYWFLDAFDFATTNNRHSLRNYTYLVHKGGIPIFCHLVNHRFHPVCYFSVISIASVIYFSIGLIGAGYTGVAMTRIDWFEACFQLLGLVLISIALVFPASFPEANVNIIKTEAEVQSLPEGFDD